MTTGITVSCAAAATAIAAAGTGTVKETMEAARERALAAAIVAAASEEMLWVSGASPHCRRCAFCCLSSSCEASYRSQYVNTAWGLGCSEVLDADALGTAGSLASVLDTAPVNTNGTADSADAAPVHAGASDAGGAGAMNQSDCEGPVAPESSTANMASITAAADDDDDDAASVDVTAAATAAAVSESSPACSPQEGTDVVKLAVDAVPAEMFAPSAVIFAACTDELATAVSTCSAEDPARVQMQAKGSNRRLGITSSHVSSQPIMLRLDF